ncbi:adhesive domain-containing protein, partial [Enterococcus faecium]|uniref:adhesive domain-containing protein n=1 Tax=Enterococcus faecium TaxID=1352 RepID=UPI0030C7B816
MTTAVTIPAADLPVGGLLDLLNSLISVLNLLPTLRPTITSINQAITNLKNEDFGTHNIPISTEQLSSTLLGVNISQGLLPILSSTLATRLKDLKNILDTLPLGLVGTILTSVLSSVNSLIASLENPDSTSSTNLVSASLLGATNVSIPTFVSSPIVLTQDYRA